MKSNDPPDEVLEALINADRDQTVERLNTAIRDLAVCQRKLGLRGVMTTVEVSGDVLISIVADTSSGKAGYARVNRRTYKMDVLGPLPEPKKADDTDIESFIEPKK